MGALPKQRTSHARQGERRSHQHWLYRNWLPAHSAKAPLSHHACPNCGTIVVARCSCQGKEKIRRQETAF